jgi:hypothetical protein
LVCAAPICQCCAEFNFSHPVRWCPLGPKLPKLPKLPLGTLNSLERRHLIKTQFSVIGK